MKKRIVKWSMLLASTAFAVTAVQGCDVTQLIQQLLGTIGGGGSV